MIEYSRLHRVQFSNSDSEPAEIIKSILYNYIYVWSFSLSTVSYLIIEPWTPAGAPQRNSMYNQGTPWYNYT